MGEHQSKDSKQVFKQNYDINSPEFRHLKKYRNMKKYSYLDALKLGELVGWLVVVEISFWGFLVAAVFLVKYFGF